MKTDPVCGQSVDPLRARAVAIVSGERYFFCSPEHRDRFLDDPARFVAALRPEPPVTSAALSPTPVAVAAPAPMSVDEAVESRRFEIGGMTGPEDAERVRRAASKAPGVVAVEVDLVAEVANLKVNPARFAPSTLVAAVATAGYEASPRRAAARLAEPHAAPALFLRGAVAVLYGAVLAAIPASSVVRVIFGALGIAYVARRARPAALEAQVLAAALLLLGAALLDGGAYAGAAVIAAAFLPLARGLELVARRGVDTALASAPPLPETGLAAGDRVRLTADEVVPVDGVVISERGVVDETRSGGAARAERGPGDAVVAGTRLVEGELVVEARRVGAERALARVPAALATIVETTSPTVRFAHAAARLAPLVAMAAAVVAAASRWLVGDGAAQALAAAAGVLVAICPLGAALATPAARARAAARAAARGVLFRNADALERGAGLDTIFVDKGATLTQRRRQLAGRAVVEGGDAARLLALAAAAEQASDAPLARALRAGAEAEGLLVPPAEQASYASGKGVTATVAGASVAVGSRRMAETAGVAAAALDELVARLACAGTTLYVLIDGQLAGALAVDEPLRAGATAFVTRLKERGLRVALLTGDEEGTAAAVAAEAGIGDVHAGLGPDDKKRVVAQARGRGETVAVAGDSVDDGPALAAADLGVALGRGAELELAAGGVTVLRGDLDGVIAALDLSRRATLTMRGGLALAIAVGAAALAVFAATSLGVWGAPLAAAAALFVLGVEVAAAANLGL